DDEDDEVEMVDINEELIDKDDEEDDEDGDGILNTVDADDDNDGVLDVEDSDDFNPLIAGDLDNDGIDDLVDLDADGDGLLDVDELSVFLRDTDNDGVINFIDSDDDGDGIADISDAFLLDTDNDGLKNDVDDDDDNDQMADAFELLWSFNILDASDAAADLDGDGASNVEEFLAGTNPSVDTVAPSCVAPDDITVDATGLLTSVMLGTAVSVDVLDPSPDVTSDAPDLFTPGNHTIAWTCQDNKGNTAATVTQNLKVRPLVDFGIDQLIGDALIDQQASEGTAVSVCAYLNGEAANYPVKLSYVVSGLATPDVDYVFEPVDFIFAATEPPTLKTCATVLVALDDDFNEENESIIFTMTSADNAVIGHKNTHTITLSEYNIAPIISFFMQQKDVNVSTVNNDQGLVVVAASIQDANTGDKHTYDWSLSEQGLLDIATVIDGSQIIFDALNLSEGIHSLILQVFDDGEPVKFTQKEWSVIVSVNEQAVDTDNDGIADINDSISQSHLIQSVEGEDEAYIISTDAGASISLGDLAIALESQASTITLADIQVLSPGIEIDEFHSASGYSDLRISDLTTAGQTASLILPLNTAITENTIVRLLKDDWASFIEDNDNKLYSAAGEPGSCPGLGSDEYQPGLTPGHWCLLAEVVDGGINDSDGNANAAVTLTMGQGRVDTQISFTQQSNETSADVALQAAAGFGRPVLAFEINTAHVIELDSFSFEAQGGGLDYLIAEVNVYVDVDGDHTVSAADTLIAQGAFITDNGYLNLPIVTGYQLNIGATAFIVTYVFE
ncbi:MAG: hypothetical protein HRU20_28450, partial [Pseudomonadales bacterium]|nr:hypothetical protein [Pseudomonadales bacterium]